jgi:hypothetical protein
VAVTPAAEAETPSLPALDWSPSPRLYWHAKMTAKPDARVVLRAGDDPVLALGRFGLGRVAVCGASVEGEPAAGETAWHRWPGAPRLLAWTIRWLSETAPAVAPPPAPPVPSAAASARGRYPADPLAVPDVIGDDHRAWQQTRLRALLAGESAAADDVVTALLGNLYVISRGRSEGNKSADSRRRAQEALAAELRWQAACYEQLNAAPDAARPALAAALAARTDWRVTPIALAAFAGRTIDAASADALRRSPVAAVAALSARL